MRKLRAPFSLRMLVLLAVICGGAFGDAPADAARRRNTPRRKSVRISSVRSLRTEVRRAIRKECRKPGKLGVIVRAVLTNETLFSHHANRKRIPASNQKLLTTAAALAVLGPDYTFPTDVYADAPIRRGVLRGNLYLKGYGDPVFVQERMRELARQVYLRGVRRVIGDVVGDDSFFDRRRYGPNWRNAGAPNPYLAPHSALSLNFSLVTVWIEPGRRIGARPRIQLDPLNEGLRLLNRAVTGRRRRRARIRVNRRKGRKKGSLEIVVSGTFPISGKRTRYHVAVLHPTYFALNSFAAFLRKEGVGLGVGKRIGVTPVGAKLVARQVSRSLSSIVNDLNKFSNNLVAEQILKTLGAEVYGLPGTTEKGLRVVRGFLRALGAPSRSFELADGSGLSRTNRITPRTLSLVLEKMYKDFRLRPEFLGSLGVVGVDGTIRKRLRKSRAARRVRAKTGLLDGVHALSGYAAARNGETLVFSILVNNNACRPKRLTDRVLLAMTAFDRPLSRSLRVQLEDVRRMFSIPMPRPADRDRWRRRGRPRGDSPASALGGSRPFRR